MKWDSGYDSQDVEDRRGQGPPLMRGGGGLGMLLPLVMRFGWKGGLIFFALFLLVGRFLTGGPSPSSDQKAGHDPTRAFVGSVLDDVQGVWEQKLPNYERAKVVLYSGATGTGCGYGAASVGPFYCPRDGRVYLDASFFDELRRRYGAPG